MKTYGYVWKLAIAHILCTSPNAQGQLWLGRDGELVVLDDDGDTAPDGAQYVATLRESSNVDQVAARLAHVATQLA